jgi:hypothetical protein
MFVVFKNIRRFNKGFSCLGFYKEILIGIDYDKDFYESACGGLLGLVEPRQHGAVLHGGEWRGGPRIQKVAKPAIHDRRSRRPGKISAKIPRAARQGQKSQGLSKNSDLLPRVQLPGVHCKISTTFLEAPPAELPQVILYRNRLSFQGNFLPKP